MKKTLNIFTYLFIASALTFGYLAFTSQKSVLTYFSGCIVSFVGIILTLYYQLSLEKKQTETLIKLIQNDALKEEELETNNEENTINFEEEVTKLEQQLDAFIPTIQATEFKTKEDCLISKIAELTHSDLGLLYKIDTQIYVVGTCAHIFENEEDKIFNKTEGILGQVVKSKTTIHLKNIPEGYIKIISGLGKSNPKNVLFFPIIDSEKVIGIIEIAAFELYTEVTKQFLERIIPTLVKIIKGTKLHE